MKGVEERIEAQLSTLGNGITTHLSQTTFLLGTKINAYTTRTAKILIDIHSNQHSHLVEQIHLLTDA